MSTKSILKNIVIKDKKTSSSLINAIESAKGKHSKDVVYSRVVRNADDEMIKKIFEVKK